LKDLAPIILFTYNRPEHTRITLEHLKENHLAEDSILYIYCDGPKEGATQMQMEKIDEVKKVIRSVQWTKEVHINEAVENKGLARNVIDGVTEIVNKHGKVIVLEDDLILSTSFLSYMNNALDKYEKDTIVKQVSGFLFPIDIEEKNEAFFMPLTNTIGWGTWRRAWSEIDLTAPGYERLKTDKRLRHQFNLDGSYDYTSMLLKQMKNENFGSWAILYWWHVFNQKGLVLFPDYPLVQHNDFGNMGTHSGSDDHYTKSNWKNNYIVSNFPEKVMMDEKKYMVFKKYIKSYSRFSLSNFKIKLKKLLKIGR